MTPSLARRGKLVLAAGVWFAVIGGFYSAGPLVAMGATVVCAVMAAYLYFYPTAILLRRRKIELSWWVPPGDGPGGALSVDRPFQLHLALRNHGFRALRVLRIRILATSAIEAPEDLEANVPAGNQVELAGETRARQAGYQVLHGAVLFFGDALGLFEVRAYFPNPIAVKVFPHANTMRSQASARPQNASLHERSGMHFVRQRGLAGELREIRDHAHGDPFKFIAWKPTARRQKLMVREHETEIVVSHQFLVDIGGTMRAGAPGHTKLDYAIDTTTSLARAALDHGDRVGLVTFDTRVYASLKPTDGHHHFLQLVDRLIETLQIVDEDLTDVTSGELVAAVAHYLGKQEAVDVRVKRAPPLDDRVWERIQAGPHGELYDLGVIDTVIKTMLKSIGSSRKQLAPAWWWKRIYEVGDPDPRLARMRLFCRLRGIELPYQLSPEVGRRGRGLARALEHATSSGRSDVVVLVSDLMGV
ncbi:MAG: DUF58 domain-containing protein, partial [Deltaproteobacteria bacterium]|nr:DUF58 domain-containing protein [Deltaproteobacteria bacterium]